MAEEEEDKIKEKYIEHLSKEIEITINNLYTFRMRSAFTVWIGPFILLGAVIVAGKSSIFSGEGAISITSGGGMMVAAGLSFAAYMALGIGAGRIEKANWNRVEALRELLSEATGLTKEDQRKFQDKKIPKYILRSYVGVFVAISVVFGCAVYIIGNLKFERTAAASSASQAMKVLPPEPHKSTKRTKNE